MFIGDLDQGKGVVTGGIFEPFPGELLPLSESGWISSDTIIANQRGEELNKPEYKAWNCVCIEITHVLWAVQKWVKHFHGIWLTTAIEK